MTTWWRHCWKSYQYLSKIGVIKRYGVCLVSFQIVDQIRRQSSWAIVANSCSHRRRRRDKTVSSRRRRPCVLGMCLKAYGAHGQCLNTCLMTSLMSSRNNLCRNLRAKYIGNESAGYGSNGQPIGKCPSAIVWACSRWRHVTRWHHNGDVMIFLENAIRPMLLLRRTAYRPTEDWEDRPTG